MEKWRDLLKSLLLRGWVSQQSARLAWLCMDAREEKNMFPPWLGFSPFSQEVGLSWQFMNSSPTKRWVRCKGAIQLWGGLQFLPVPSSHAHTIPCLSLCPLPSTLHTLHWWRRQSPPLQKVQLVWYGERNSVGPRQNQEKTRSCNSLETEAELSILLYISS